MILKICKIYVHKINGFSPVDRVINIDSACYNFP